MFNWSHECAFHAIKESKDDANLMRYQIQDSLLINLRIKQCH